MRRSQCRGVGFNKACLFFYNLDMGRKIAWAKIRRDYVTKGKSQRELAAEYSVSPSEIARHCKEEEWVKKRAAHRSKTSAKAEQKIADRQAAQLARITDIAEKTTEQIARLLEMEMSDPMLLLGTGMHNREIESKVNALTKLYDLMARAQGIMAPKDAEKARLEREKFEFEKSKFEQETNEDKNVEIVMTGDLERWSE